MIAVPGKDAAVMYGILNISAFIKTNTLSSITKNESDPNYYQPQIFSPSQVIDKSLTIDNPSLV